MQSLMEGILLDGSLATALSVVLFIGIGFLVERLAMVRGWRGYYRVGVPLRPPLVPIQELPAGEGVTETVRWAVVEDSAFFWSDPKKRSAPMGLHGRVDFLRTAQGVQLSVYWSLPWVPVLAIAWFGGLGLVTGQGTITVPTAALLVAALFFLYRVAAVRAVAELRWAWIGG